MPASILSAAPTEGAIATTTPQVKATEPSGSPSYRRERVRICGREDWAVGLAAAVESGPASEERRQEAAPWSWLSPRPAPMSPSIT